MNYLTAEKLILHVNHGDARDQKTLQEQAERLVFMFNQMNQTRIDRRFWTSVTGLVLLGYVFIWTLGCCLSTAGGYKDPPLPNTFGEVLVVLSPSNHPWLFIFMTLITAVVGAIIAVVKYGDEK